MDCRALASHRLPHQSKLFLDYVDKFSRVDAILRACAEDGFGYASGAQLKFPERQTPRSCWDFACAELLRWRARGARKSGRLEKGAVTIVSGQQVGLFSGPAYSFYKAFTAIQLAEELTKSGIAAVPVFWMATEDHDIDEVRHVSWFQEGALKRFELPLPDAADAGRPVGQSPARSPRGRTGP